MGVIEARRRILLTTPHPVTTTPAPVASFDTDMVGKLRSAKFAFSPVQSGSGDPSPTNVRAISGWMGLDVFRAGHNLLDYSTETAGYRLNNVGAVIASGKFATSDYISVKEGASYYFSSLIPSGYGYSIWCYGDKSENSAINYKNIGTGTSPESGSYTIPTGTGIRYIRVSYWKDHTGDPAVLYPSTATAYAPYTGSTYPVTWQSAGTIYGGYVDLVKGELVAEWVSCSFEGDVCSTLWYDGDSGRDTLGFYRTARVWSIVDYPTPVDGGGIFDYCKTGTVYNENTPWVARFLFMNGSFNRFEMRIPKSVLADITSESAAKQSVVSYLDAHPLQAVYKIEPITYAITPTIIKSLKGANNLWSNANGDATITYWTH